MTMVWRVGVADKTSWYRIHIIVRNYKILLIVPTLSMFATDIERGRVARAGGGYLRQARPKVQRICNPTPIFVVDLAGTPDNVPPHAFY